MNFTIRKIKLLSNLDIEATILKKHSQLPKNARYLFFDNELNNEGILINEVSAYKTFNNGKIYAILKPF